MLNQTFINYKKKNLCNKTYLFVFSTNNTANAYKITSYIEIKSQW